MGRHKSAGVGARPHFTNMTSDEIDGLLENGTLPGIYGLGQRVLELWATKNESPLDNVRKVLRTIGYVRDYRKAGEPQDHEDPLEEFLASRKLYRTAGFLGSTLSVTLFPTLRDSNWDRKVVDLMDKTKSGVYATIYEFRTPAGQSLYFATVPQGEFNIRRGIKSVSKYSIEGPFIVPSEEETIIEATRTLIWDSIGGGGGTLLLTHRQMEFEASAVITQGTRPGDYVANPGEATELDKLTARVKTMLVAGIRRSVLLHGPSGTGKSTLARELGRQCGRGRILLADAATLGNVADVEIKAIFQFLQPDALILDDIDRDDSYLLHMIEVQTIPLLIATVNAIEVLDPALLRAQRFDEVWEVLIPAKAHRNAIARHYAMHYKLGTEMMDLVLGAIDSFTPAETLELVRRASVLPPELLAVEVERITRQQELYTQDKIAAFLKNHD
jgi:hypothetical protein